MARILTQPDQTVGPNSAPSAPAAPAVRSTQGSMSGQAATTSFKAPVQSPAPVVTPKAPTQNVPSSYGQNNRFDPRAGDPEYWSNVAIINNEFSRGMGSALVEQEQSQMEFGRAQTDLKTGRETARRSLAESMLGKGNIYSGSHRKQQTVGDTEFVQQFGRLNEDFALGDRQRQLDRDDLERRLGPVGSEIMDLQRKATDREKQRLLDEAANNDPEYKMPGVKERLKSTNQRLKAQGNRIAKLKKQLVTTTNPYARERINKQINSLRQQRVKGARKQKVLKYAVDNDVTGGEARQHFAGRQLRNVNGQLKQLNGSIDRLKLKRDHFKTGSAGWRKINDRISGQQAKRKVLVAKRNKLKGKAGK